MLTNFLTPQGLIQMWPKTRQGACISFWNETHQHVFCLTQPGQTHESFMVVTPLTSIPGSAPTTCDLIFVIMAKRFSCIGINIAKLESCVVCL